VPVNVCTGEVIRTLELDSVIQSHMLSVLLPDMKSSHRLAIPGQTRIEHINGAFTGVLVYEYAQI
jgi:hypothetical protein